MKNLELHVPPNFWFDDEPHHRLLFARLLSGRFVPIELSEMAGFEDGRRSLPLPQGWAEFMEIDLTLTVNGEAYGLKPTVKQFRRPVAANGCLDQISLASARKQAVEGTARVLGWSVTQEEDVLLRSAFARLAASAPSIVDDFFMRLLLPR